MRTARPRHTVGGLLLGASWLLFATLASAVVYPGGTRLSYTLGPGTASCLDEEGFRDTVAAQLDGIDHFTPDGAWRFGVTISRGRGGFKGEITVHDGEGRAHGRDQLVTPTCRETVDVVANTLVGLLFTFPEDRVPTPAAQPAPPPTAPPGPPAPPAPPPPVALTAASGPPVAVRPRPFPVPAPTPPRLELGAGLLVTQGFAPDMAVGFAGAAGIRWPGTSLLIELRGDLPVSTEVQDGATVETSWQGASLVACQHQAWLFGCGLVTAGRTRDRLLSDRIPWVKTNLSAAAGLRAGLEVPFSSRFAGQLSADFLVRAARPPVRFEQRVVWNAPPLSQVVSLRLVTFF